jgi:hypothetical protein
MLKLVQTDDQRTTHSDCILIHVRYLSNSDVMTIDKCPPHLTAQEWRNLLLSEAPGCYQTFAGARGCFRIPRHVYDGILANVTPMAAE